jgi:hypothetical protein
MVEYKEGRASIRGHKSWTIRNTKLDSPISLGQTNTSTTRSLSDKRSRTPSWCSSEGQDHRQQDYHLTHYFSFRSPMPEPWGPSPMMYPPWAGWYEPWALSLMPFHPGWSGPTRDGQDLLRILATVATMQETTVTDTLATSRTTKF